MNLILNRDFKMPDDGWYQLAPLGEFPHGVAGVIQVVDAEACAAMVARFKADAGIQPFDKLRAERFAGLLVDFDHFSLDAQARSEAAGWIVDLASRDTGLWANIRWSDVGEEAVKGGRYAQSYWTRCVPCAPRAWRTTRPVFGAVLDVQGGHKLRRFQRDLVAAGIPYKDAQGRIADFHALSRVTPNTHMGQRGVGERVRQEFMRHSDLRLTSAVYTDVDQLPTKEAVQRLPSFAADCEAHKCAQRGAQSPVVLRHSVAQPVAEDWVI